MRAASRRSKPRTCRGCPSASTLPPEGGRPLRRSTLLDPAMSETMPLAWSDRVLVYRMLAHSVLRCVGQFVAPDTGVARAGHAAVATPTGVRMHSIGPAIAVHLTAIGVAKEFGSIVFLARASQMTMVAMSPDAAACLEDLRLAMRPLSRGIRNVIASNIASFLRSAVEHYAGLQPMKERVGARGAVVGHSAQTEALGRRARYWLHRDVPEVEHEVAVARARTVFSTFPDNVGVQLLRVWRSPWPTKRFGDGMDSCRWGCCAVGG